MKTVRASHNSKYDDGQIYHQIGNSLFVAKFKKARRQNTEDKGRGKGLEAVLGVENDYQINMMILLQQNKERRETGRKCHNGTMMHSKPINLSK